MLASRFEGYSTRAAAVCARACPPASATGAGGCRRAAHQEPTPADIGQIPTPHDYSSLAAFLLGTLALSKAGSVPNRRDGPNQWVEELAAPLRS